MHQLTWIVGFALISCGKAWSTPASLRMWMAQVGLGPRGALSSPGCCNELQRLNKVCWQNPVHIQLSPGFRGLTRSFVSLRASVTLGKPRSLRLWCQDEDGRAAQAVLREFPPPSPPSILLSLHCLETEVQM